MKNLIFPYQENLTQWCAICVCRDEAFALRKDLLKPFSQKKNSLLMNVGYLITVCHEPGG
jgi:hypothetical protein